MDTKVKIGGMELEIPPDVISLEEDLYAVPFNLLVIAQVQESQDKYQWENPRHYGKNADSNGRGFTKDEMEELYITIQEDGLMMPFICRWVIDDGKLAIQVLDGERRWNCLDCLIEKKEKVWSRKEKKWLPADQVYNKIPCRIVTGNDKETLKIAFMVSDRSVSWGEGAKAKLIKKLRSCNSTDEEILELTKKSTQWLREMDRICELDELTFSYLTDGKINRALALQLVDIEDLEKRHFWLHGSYDNAVECHEEILSQANEALTKAENKEELAEVELAELKERGDDTTAAEEKLEDAKENTESKRKKRTNVAKPQAKSKNLKVIHGEEPDKFATHLEVLEELLTKEDEVLPLASLHLLKAYISQCVLGDDEDINKFLKRQRSAALIVQKRVKA